MTKLEQYKLDVKYKHSVMGLNKIIEQYTMLKLEFILMCLNMLSFSFLGSLWALFMATMTRIFIIMPNKAMMGVSMTKMRSSASLNKLIRSVSLLKSKPSPFMLKFCF